MQNEELLVGFAWLVCVYSEVVARTGHTLINFALQQKNARQSNTGRAKVNLT